VDGGSWIEEKAASSSWLGLEVPVRPWNILFQVLHAGAIQFAWEIKRLMRKRLTLRSAIHDPFTFAFIRGSASFFKASSLRVTWPEGSNARVARVSQKRWARCPRLLEGAGGTPALPFEEAADHSRGPLGTKVPAYLSSTIFFIRGLNSFFNASALRGRTALPGLQRLAGAKIAVF
jgi:hypothetical protein